ncbi:tetratricopeptide repeat protein [Pedobacter mucosus]|uniref:tetratricopeptide repeat protein n=1 Tax=Pedobacter mucosus TaxID=2895286 RepID=UPI001EE3FCFF|nr:tetratricopeptide repeat protein [Pedobacter mucosus]UKT64494.1 tetratricopeptide repeat protein [Pedobacter mucosus]
MIKPLIITIAILISVSCYGQSTTYSTWKKEAQNDAKLLPKYGNKEKTQEQKEADEELIKIAIQSDETREKASDHHVQLGFNYLGRQDFKTAMNRFNQAWLLNPKNENVFWGFGGVYFSFNDFENAIKQYDDGLLLNPRSTNILTDKATIFLTKFNQENSFSDLAIAIGLFETSYGIDPKNQNTLFKLSVCYFLKSDCENAKKFYKECMALGGKPITKEYTDALEETCKK